MIIGNFCVRFACVRNYLCNHITLTGIENQKTRRSWSNRSNTYEFPSANEFHESPDYKVEFEFRGCWNVSNIQTSEITSSIFARISCVQTHCPQLNMLSTFNFQEDNELKSSNVIMSNNVYLAKSLL